MSQIPDTKHHVPTNLCGQPHCGSCTWSVKPYPDQLQEKLQNVNDAMHKHRAHLEVSSIIPSPQTDHYRNRMDFVINFEGKMGLREKGKWWSVLDDHHCAIAHPEIERLFDVTRDWVHQSGLSYFDRKAHHGLLRYAVIRATADGQTMLILITSQPQDEADELKSQLQILTSSLPQTSLYHAINPTISDTSTAEEYIHISGPQHLIETFHTPAGDIHYMISPSAFFQTNPYTAQLLLDTVLEMTSQISPPPAKGEMEGVTNKSHKNSQEPITNNPQLKILDLYCGSGFFSLPLAALGHTVTGIELVDQAIQDANQNIDLNQVFLTEHSVAKSTSHSHPQKNRENNIFLTERSVTESNSHSQATQKAKENNAFLTERSVAESKSRAAVPPHFRATPAEDLSWAQEPYDLLILDPPRAGLHPTVLDAIMGMAPPDIIYISCGYKNFARELAILQTKYNVITSTALDMFPHTPHLELVTHLTLR